MLAEPDIQVFQWQPDDLIILACDGLWDVRTNQEACDYMMSALEQHGSLERATKELVNAAEHEWYSEDNVTVVTVMT